MTPQLKAAQQKLLDQIFGSGYAQGLPEMSSDLRNAGWYWTATNCEKDDGRTYAQDINGTWFVMDCDYTD